MKRRWRPSRTRWKRRAGAARTPRKCWASATEPCSTRCGSLTWTRRERAGRYRQWPQVKKRHQWVPFGTPSITRIYGYIEIGTQGQESRNHDALGAGPIFDSAKEAIPVLSPEIKAMGA